LSESHSPSLKVVQSEFCQQRTSALLSSSAVLTPPTNLHCHPLCFMFLHWK